MSDLRETILKTDDTVYETVSVPEWKTDVVVRGISGEERDLFEESLQKEVKRVQRGKVKTERKFNPRNARARLAILACCKAVGDPTPIFKREDEAQLGTKSSAALDRIFDVAQRLAGIRDEDLEELLGNSEAAPKGGNG